MSASHEIIEEKVTTGRAAGRRSEAAARFVAAIEAHPGRCATALALLFFVPQIALARLVPLWFDELFTFHLASLPGFSAIWHAIGRGTEANPPLSFWIAHVSTLLFGQNEFALRLPSMLAFDLCGAFVYKMLRHYTGAVAAFCGVLIPSLGFAESCASEARPYALLMCATAAALYFYSAATTQGRSWRNIAGLSLSICAAVYLHYYGLYITGALVLGELHRSREIKRIDLPLWTALASIVLSMSSLLPLLRLQATFASHFWSGPDFIMAISTYPYMVSRIAFVLPFVAFVVAFPVGRRPRAEAVSGSDRGTIAEESCVVPPHITFTLAVLLAMPVLVALGAVVLPLACFHRYFTPAVIAFAILSGVALEQLLRRDIVRGVRVIAVIMFVFAGGQLLKCLLFGSPGPAEVIRSHIASFGTFDVPIVHGNPLLFFQQFHYADARDRAQMFYLTDRNSAAKIMGYDTADISLVAGHELFGIPAVPYAEFVRMHKHFVVIAETAEEFVLSKLVADGAVVRLTRRMKIPEWIPPDSPVRGEVLIYDVTH